MDTLKGNLDLFGLEAIAGLLSSARKTGALRVAVDGLKGRLFFVEGALVYGTTRKLDGSVNDLRGRGTEVRDRRRNWSLSLPELLRHQITDVLVRMLRRDGGEFMFDEGVTTTALPSGRTLSFNAAEMIRRAEERLEEWRGIEEAIPDSTVKYRLAADLPPDLFEVTIDARMWTFLAEVGDGASAGDIAERLRIFEFPAAQKMAESVRRGLLVPVDAEVAAQALRDNRAARSAHREPDESRLAAADDPERHTPPVEPDPSSPGEVVVTMVEAPIENEGHGSPDTAVDDPVADGNVPPVESDHPGFDDVTDAQASPQDDAPEIDADPAPGGGFDGSDTPHEVFAAETASQALAEWGESDRTEGHATLDTQATTEVITDVDPQGPSPAPVGDQPPGDPYEGESAPDETIDPATVELGPIPPPPAPIPQVPAPPPWIPAGGAAEHEAD